MWGKQKTPQMWDLGKNFKRQLPNQVHAVLGVGGGCLSFRCLSNDILWHTMNPLWQIGNTGITILTYQSKSHLTEKGLTNNGRIYNLS